MLALSLSAVSFATVTDPLDPVAFEKNRIQTYKQLCELQKRGDNNKDYKAYRQDFFNNLATALNATDESLLATRFGYQYKGFMNGLKDLVKANGSDTGSAQVLIKSLVTYKDVNGQEQTGFLKFVKPENGAKEVDDIVGLRDYQDRFDAFKEVVGGDIALPHNVGRIRYNNENYYFTLSRLASGGALKDFYGNSTKYIVNGQDQRTIAAHKLGQITASMHENLKAVHKDFHLGNVFYNVSTQEVSVIDIGSMELSNVSQYNLGFYKDGIKKDFMDLMKSYAGVSLHQIGSRDENEKLISSYSYSDYVKFFWEPFMKGYAASSTKLHAEKVAQFLAEDGVAKYVATGLNGGSFFKYGTRAWDATYLRDIAIDALKTSTSYQSASINLSERYEAIKDKRRISENLRKFNEEYAKSQEEQKKNQLKILADKEARKQAQKLALDKELNTLSKNSEFQALIAKLSKTTHSESDWNQSCRFEILPEDLMASVYEKSTEIVVD